MGNESSLPMSCTEFDADEIRRLGKRFKKLVALHLQFNRNTRTIMMFRLFSQTSLANTRTKFSKFILFA